MTLGIPARLAKILIVRRDNIGDLVCTTPAFSALRASFPGAEIGILVNSYNADVLRGNPNLDLVFVYKKLKHASGLLNKLKALLERIRVIRKLKSWNPDVTILAKSSYDRHGLNFARMIGARNIVGFVPSDCGQLTTLPDVSLPTPAFADFHEVEVINLLLAPLGIDDALGPLQVFPDWKAVVALESHLPSAAKRVALHISAREPERRWGLDNFIGLANYIIKSTPNVQILLLWSPGKCDDPFHPGDDESAMQLIHSVSSPQLIPMPTQNLTELVASLALCDLFVGADGGAMHLAAAMNIKIIALFERLSGKLNHWYPWGVEHLVIHSDEAATPEIGQIGKNQVQEAFNSLI